ncbi:MAG TPA: methyl-accepting chemotaxis protein [Bryobacteraceae bacterium]|nr:methyl-accepting chemotaxis protein [Bryobacteraceae bacterium]
MYWYKNAKTATKLMLAFGLLAGLLAIVGYEGIGAASSLNGMLDTLYEHHLLGTIYIQDMQTAIPTIARDVREALLTNDANFRQRTVQNLQEQFSALEDLTALAERNLVSDAGRAEIGRFKRFEAQYREAILGVARLAAAGQDKQVPAELDKARSVGRELNESCTKLVKMKQDLGKQAHEESAALYYSVRRTLIAVVSGAILLAAGLGLFIARMIARPLAQTVGVLRAISERDLTRTLAIETRDEVGEMAQALNQACAGMREAMVEVRESSGGVASAAEQLAAAAEELSSGTQEQASSQEETSSSLQELSTAVKQNAQNARQASELASGARDAADKGGAVVHSAVTAMSEINAASKRIADIITAIDEIAFQTNLLALNAAVEAARAGEQGRGFAVVAAEVRNLAQRSATAAKEIKSLIQDSVRKVDAGSELVNRSGQTLTEIVASVKRVTDIVGEIAAASQQQAVGIEQVTKAMAQMDQVTQTNSAQTEELSSTSQTLAAHATQMQSLVSRFVLNSGSGYGAGADQTAGRPSAKGDGTTRRSLSTLAREVSKHTARPAVFEEF